MSALKQNLVYFIKFGIVGASGVVVNLIVYSLCVFGMGLGENVAAIIAFAVAVTTNYFLNNNWTFKSDSKRSFDGGFYARYVIINLIGLAINLVVLNLLLGVLSAMFQPPLLALAAQLGGIAAAMLANFVLSRLFVFQDV